MALHESDYTILHTFGECASRSSIRQLAPRHHFQVNLPPPMKRALASSSSNPFLDPNLRAHDEPTKSAADENGKKLRDFLISGYSAQTTVNASFVTELCQLITDAGGVGVRDLACNPENGSKHLKLVLGREFGDQDLHYVQTPVYCKKTACRDSQSIPVHLPSAIFADEFEDHVEPNSSHEPESSSRNFDCDAWRASKLRVP